MKTILVTGGTGFLGKHLVEELKRQEPDSRLRLLCRRESVGERDDPQAEVVRGDITSPQDVSAAAQGVEEIYHLAGPVEREPRDPTRLYRTHIEGVRNVCEAVREHQVKKAVLVSSSGTVAVSREPVKRNEDSGYTNGITSRWPYYAGKIFAEKLVFRYAEQEQLPIVVVNPSLLLGPGDERGSSTKDTALFLDGQVMAVPRGGLSIVDVRDAAAGVDPGHAARQAGGALHPGRPELDLPRVDGEDRAACRSESAEASLAAVAVPLVCSTNAFVAAADWQVV